MKTPFIGFLAVLLAASGQQAHARSGNSNYSKVFKQAKDILRKDCRGKGFVQYLEQSMEEDSIRISCDENPSVKAAYFNSNDSTIILPDAFCRNPNDTALGIFKAGYPSYLRSKFKDGYAKVSTNPNFQGQLEGFVDRLTIGSDCENPRTTTANADNPEDGRFHDTYVNGKLVRHLGPGNSTALASAAEIAGQLNGKAGGGPGLGNAPAASLGGFTGKQGFSPQSPLAAIPPNAPRMQGAPPDLAKDMNGKVIGLYSEGKLVHIATDYNDFRNWMLGNAKGSDPNASYSWGDAVMLAQREEAKQAKVAALFGDLNKLPSGKQPSKADNLNSLQIFYSGYQLPKGVLTEINASGGISRALTVPQGNEGPPASLVLTSDKIIYISPDPKGKLVSKSYPLNDMSGPVGVWESGYYFLRGTGQPQIALSEAATADDHANAEKFVDAIKKAKENLKAAPAPDTSRTAIAVNALNPKR